jgi:hypothetical protein
MGPGRCRSREEVARQELLRLTSLVTAAMTQHTLKLQSESVPNSMGKLSWSPSNVHGEVTVIFYVVTIHTCSSRCGVFVSEKEVL